MFEFFFLKRIKELRSQMMYYGKSHVNTKFIIKFIFISLFSLDST